MSEFVKVLFAYFRRRRQNTGIVLAVYGLVVLFGSSSWLNVNSVWVELPLLVYRLPEFWTLPSFLAVIIQIACGGPIVYSLIKKFRPHDPGPVIAGLIAFACVATLLLACLWDRTGWIGDAEHSVALFSLFFCVSIMNCTSSVLFLPYMALFKPPYMTAYFIGMGVSALVPSIFSLIQGAGHTVCLPTNASAVQSPNVTSPMQAVQIPPNFSVGAFNGIMCAWMCLTLVAFILLNWTKYAKSERAVCVVNGNNTGTHIMKASSSETVIVPKLTDGGGGEEDPKLVASALNKYVEEPRREEMKPSVPEPVMSTGLYLFLLLLTAWVSALMNGILPSIQSYACLPYGQTTYHLSVTLSNIANPVACFVPFFVQLTRPVPVITVLTIIATGISAYVTALAVFSPDTILVSSDWGPALCIVSWIVLFGVLAYLRTAMAGCLRAAAGDSATKLFWCGACTQMGSFIGAVVMFPLVNVYQLFKAASMC